MNARWIALLAVAAVGLGWVGGFVTAGEHEDKAPGAGDTAEMPMAAPGEEHKELAKVAGEWHAENTYYTPQGEVVSKDAETARVVMNGWFVETDYSGSMMGKPWKGRSVTGFDQHTKEYVVVWYSEMGSAISVHRGKKCPKGIIHLYGQTFNPMAGKVVPSLMQMHPTDESGKHKFEMYWSNEAKEPVTKLMSIVYTRKE